MGLPGIPRSGVSADIACGQGVFEIEISNVGCNRRHLLASFPEEDSGVGLGGDGQGEGSMLCLTREVDMGVVAPLRMGGLCARRRVYVEGLRTGPAKLPAMLVRDLPTGQSFSLALPFATTVLDDASSL